MVKVSRVVALAFVFVMGQSFFAHTFVSAGGNEVSITLSKTSLEVDQTIVITVKSLDPKYNRVGVYLLPAEDFAAPINAADELSPKHLCEYLPDFRYQIHGYRVLSRNAISPAVITWKAQPRLGDMYVVVNLLDAGGSAVTSGAQALAKSMGFTCANIALPPTTRGFARFNVKAGSSAENATTYFTHPNFWVDWANGAYTRVGKKYNNLSDGKIIWDQSNPNGVAQRDVRYNVILNPSVCPSGEERACSIWEDSEYELWWGTGFYQSAYVYRFGGNETTSRYHYPNVSACVGNIPGMLYPGIDVSSSGHMWVEGDTVAIGSTCQKSYYDDPAKGGYTGAYVAEWWGVPRSATRQSKCDLFFSQTQGARSICLDAPNVGVVYQRYARIPSYGCETVVYAWGYPPLSAGNWQNWMSNGELRFSGWAPLDVSLVGHVKPSDHAWWNWNCQQRWNPEFVTQWFYTGQYKLEGTVFPK